MYAGTKCAGRRGSGDAPTTAHVEYVVRIRRTTSLVLGSEGMGQAFPLMPRATPRTAARALADRDPKLAAVIGAVGPPDIRPPQRTPFEALVRAICFQQLSGKAAATIHGRFVDLLGG